MSSTKQSAVDEQARIELVLDILGGETTVAKAAELHGLDPVEVECWKALYVDGLRHAATVGKPSWLRHVRSTARRRPIAVTGGALAALLVLLVPVTALSETPAGCTDAASMDLCLFVAGQPAVAEEVNSNFSKMLGWLEQKVGVAGSPDITTTGDIVAEGTDGTVSAATVDATGVTIGTDGLDVNGPVTVDSSNALLAMKLIPMGQTTAGITTGMAVADWNCFVGGLAMLNGDIQENDTGNPIYAYTYPGADADGNSVRMLAADFRSHNTDEIHTIGVVCVRTSVSRLDTWYTGAP